MSPEHPASIGLHDRVVVHAFGAHPGVVAEIGPRVSIQGRTIRPEGWVKVRLDDGREFNGHAAHLGREARAAAIAHAA